jgi:branched-chain amino acid aminotransferase
LTWAFIHDRFVPDADATLHYRDLTVQRGYGVFDFLRVENGRPIFLDDHLDRFYFSADRMHLPVAYDRDALKSLLFELINRNNWQQGGVRITLTGGYSENGFLPASPNLILSVHSFDVITETQWQEGIRLVSYEYQRQLPFIKTIDYTMAIWLQPMLRQERADDVLYHLEDRITECPRSNFFLLKEDGTLSTPETHILHGITRKKILTLHLPGTSIREENLQLSDLSAAKGAFITSTTKGILPVASIDGIEFPKPWPTLFETIRNQLSDLRCTMGSSKFEV